MGLRVPAIFAALIWISGMAFSACSSVSDCAVGETCVAGQCSFCGAETAGMPCSDTPGKDYSADGICAYEGKCAESVICLNTSIGKHFLGCSSCENGAACDTLPSGEFIPDGVCLNGRCMKDHCSSSTPSYPQSCGSAEIACSELNQGKLCDFVGDGEFAPDGKRCASGACSRGAIGQKDQNSLAEQEQKPGKSPFMGQQESPKNALPPTLAELVFGPIILDRNLFMAFALLAAVASYFVFLKTGRFFPSSASTREKQLGLMKQAGAAMLLFLLTFQLGRLSNYYVSFIFMLLVVIAIILSDNYLRRVKEQRQAIKV